MAPGLPVHPTPTHTEVRCGFIDSQVWAAGTPAARTTDRLSAHAGFLSPAASAALSVPGRRRAALRNSSRSNFFTCASDTLRTLATRAADVPELAARRISSFCSALLRCTSLPESAAETRAGSHRSSKRCLAALRSSSVKPPRIPFVSPHSSAASKQVVTTWQDEQIAFARATRCSSASPTGKKRSGSLATSTATAHAARSLQVWSPLTRELVRSSSILVLPVRRVL